ncbi:MAG TPA: HEAT repeat domain-containing protein [Planctomycetota bacterium]|nr:HEAT repeat domain-containing protein [Planctomycetota bacterium]
MALLAALVLQAASEEAIRRLIEQLSSDRIEARSEAYRKLEDIGRPALALLQKAALDPDDEVASRARTLVVRIPIREHLTPALIAVGGIYDRLALGDWTPVFLDLSADLRQGDDRRRYPGVRADDLSFMAPMAIASAKTEADKVAVCQAVGRMQLKSAIPSVLPLLRDAQATVRSNAIAAIRDTNARDQVAAVRPSLTDPSNLVRTVAAHALGRLGDQECVPQLIAMLEDDNANVRWWAVYALGELRPPTAAEAIAPLKDDPNDFVRRVARETWSQLRQKP